MLAGDAPEASKCGVRDLGHNCYLVLDGQQRIVTLRLLLLAICDEYKRQVGILPDELDRHAISSISVHGLDEEDWEHIKSGQVQQHSSHRIESADAKLRLCDAYLFIRWVLLNGEDAVSEEAPLLPPQNDSDGFLVSTWSVDLDQPLSPEGLLGVASSVLTKLEISLLLHEDRDEPVETIFESLNGLRTELGQYDLFRNFVLTQANVQGEAQKNLYTDFMQKPEKAIDHASLDYKEQKGNLQIFLADFVIMVRGGDGVSISRDNSAQRFKEWWGKEDRDLRSFIEEDLSPRMQAWLAAAGGLEKIPVLQGRERLIPPEAQRSIWRIEMFSRGPFTPLVTLALDTWMKESSSNRDERLRETLHQIETLLARMLLAGSSLSGRRRETIDSLGKGVGASLESTQQWVSDTAPTDHECQRVALQSNNTSFAEARQPEDWYHSKDLYVRSRPRPITALFDGLIQYQDGFEYSTWLALKPGTRAKGQKTRSIEHFCPQQFFGAKEWVNDLTDWNVDPDQMTNRLHSIGNLTVLPKNINSKFQRQRHEDKKGSLHTEDFPNLKINRGFVEAEKWTPKEIDARAETLVKDALAFWKLP